MKSGMTFEEFRKKINQGERVKVLEGILDSINEIDGLAQLEYNTKYGITTFESGGNCFIKSKLLIKTKNHRKKEVYYYGIILSDSLGNEVEIYTNSKIFESNVKVIQIHDLKLDRWYL
jgi:hypothetical protein